MCITPTAVQGTKHMDGEKRRDGICFGAYPVVAKAKSTDRGTALQEEARHSLRHHRTDDEM